MERLADRFLSDERRAATLRTGGTTTHMPQPTVPSKQLKKTMGSRSINRTTQPLAWVAVRNCAVMSAELSATKAWLPMDMVFDLFGALGRRRRAARARWSA